MVAGRATRSWRTSTAPSRPLVFISLLAELVQRRAKRGAGNLEQPLERLVELQDQKYCTGDRQRADEESSDYGCVSGAKSPKLAKMMLSQNTSTTRNGTGIELPNCSNSSTRVRPKSRAIVKAWLCKKR